MVKLTLRLSRHPSVDLSLLTEGEVHCFSPVQSGWVKIGVAAYGGGLESISDGERAVFVRAAMNEKDSRTWYRDGGFQKLQPCIPHMTVLTNQYGVMVKKIRGGAERAESKKKYQASLRCGLNRIYFNVTASVIWRSASARGNGTCDWCETQIFFIRWQLSRILMQCVVQCESRFRQLTAN